MTKTSGKAFAVAGMAAGLALTLGAIAQAQPAPPAPPGPGSHAGPGWAGRGFDPAGMRERMEQRREARAKLLHDALSIRADQEAAWRTFMDGMKPSEGAMPRRPMGPEARAALTTPERLDRMEQRMARRQAMLKQHADAVRQFYAALSPAQQKTFDALTALRHGGMGHGGMGMRMGPGPGPGPG